LPTKRIHGPGRNVQFVDNCENHNKIQLILFLISKNHRNYDRTKTEKRPLLRGRENFLAWLTRLEGLLMIDGVIKKNKEGQLEVAEIGDTKIENEKKTQRYIFDNCDDSVMHSINPGEKFKETVGKLMDLC
jgi:hypothetical protein